VPFSKTDIPIDGHVGSRLRKRRLALGMSHRDSPRAALGVSRSGDFYEGSSENRLAKSFALAIPNSRMALVSLVRHQNAQRDGLLRVAEVDS
jgi:hypothetical protein